MAQSATYRPPLLRRPSAAGGANSIPGRCPFLGTPADPGTALAFPSEANHCFRARIPTPISSIHQENYCLSHQYETCPVYRQYSANEQPERAEVVPVAAIAVGTATVGAATVDAPEPPRWMGESVGSAIAPAAAVAAGMALGAGRAPVAYDEPIHPDFQNDAALTPRPARSWGIEPRAVLLGLLLVAMLALAGWAVLTFLGGRDRAGSQGAIVTLPTTAATVDMSVGQTDGAVAVGADAEATATALGAAATTPTAALAGAEATATTDSAAIDSVAATATALFAGASATAECRAPDWWVAYITQEGDTVESLAASRGILPEELIVANCLASPDLTPGLALRLPPVGVIVLLPVATATPAATTAPAAAATTRPNRPNRPTPTFPAIFATPPLIIFPTPAFPIVVLPTTEPLVPEPGDPTSPAPRPTSPPRPNATATPPTLPTLTPPIFGATSTPPIFGATSTPPTFGTAEPTKTPPSAGGSASAP